MADLVHTSTRTTRKVRRCSSCGGSILPGERYLRHSAAPNGELGNVRWWHLTECAACAKSYGRPIDGAKAVA